VWTQCFTRGRKKSEEVKNWTNQSESSLPISRDKHKYMFSITNESNCLDQPTRVQYHCIKSLCHKSSCCSGSVIHIESETVCEPWSQDQTWTQTRPDWKWWVRDTVVHKDKHQLMWTKPHNNDLRDWGWRRAAADDEFRSSSVHNQTVSRWRWFRSRRGLSPAERLQQLNTEDQISVHESTSWRMESCCHRDHRGGAGGGASGSGPGQLHIMVYQGLFRIMWGCLSTCWRSGEAADDPERQSKSTFWSGLVGLRPDLLRVCLSWSGTVRGLDQTSFWTWSGSYHCARCVPWLFDCSTWLLLIFTVEANVSPHFSHSNSLWFSHQCQHYQSARFVNDNVSCAPLRYFLSQFILLQYSQTAEDRWQHLNTTHKKTTSLKIDTWFWELTEHNITVKCIIIFLLHVTKQQNDEFVWKLQEFTWKTVWPTYVKQVANVTHMSTQCIVKCKCKMYVYKVWPHRICVFKAFIVKQQQQERKFSLQQ